MVTLKRVAVKCLMSRWRQVTSDVSQRSVLGAVLFNIFVSDMDSGIEYTFSKFASDTKLSSAVNMLGGTRGTLTDLRGGSK